MKIRIAVAVDEDGTWCAADSQPGCQRGGRPTMKLLFCPDCRDVVRLYGFFRFCRCQKSRGRYVDERAVAIDGPALVFCIDSGTLPATGPEKAGGESRVHGVEVEAWILPEPHEQVRRST
jgi:hypothetical protein